MNENTVVTLAMLALIVALAIAAAIMLGLHLPSFHLTLTGLAVR